MSVSTGSRYYSLPIYEVKDANNASHPTLAMRAYTGIDPGKMQYKHLITGVENIEYLAWKFYGDSREWWRIAEANELRFPLDIHPGMTLIIPGINDVGKISRNRKF